MNKKRTKKKENGWKQQPCAMALIIMYSKAVWGNCKEETDK